MRVAAAVVMYTDLEMLLAVYLFILVTHPPLTLVEGVRRVFRTGRAVVSPYTT